MSKKFKLFVETFFSANPEVEQPENSSNQTGQKDLKKSNHEIFKYFIENLPVMFYAVAPSPNYQPIYLSQTFDRLGFSSEEWRNNRTLWLDLLHDDDRERSIANARRCAQSGEVNDQEYRVRDKDGQYFWVRDRGALIYDANTDKHYWQGIIIDIDKQKRSELELQRKEHLYRTIVQNIPLTGVMIFDHDLRFTLADGVMLGKMNLSSEMIEGRTLFEVFSQKTSSEFEKYYRKALAGNLVNIQKEVRDNFIIHNYVLPLKDQDENIYGGMSIWQDISEDYQKTRKLRESEEQYRELFDRANDIICVHDLNGNYLSLNKAGEKTFGYSREEIANLNFKDVIAPEYMPITYQMMEEKLKDLTKHTVYEIECLTKSGQRVPLEVNTSLIVRNGEPVAIHGVARDITERKQVQEALFKQEEMIRNFLENASDLIYMLDVDGKFIYVNKAMSETYGYSQEEFKTLHYSDLVAPDNLETAKQKIEAKLLRLERTIYESTGITRDGRQIILELNSFPVIKEGKVIGVQGIGRDITERRRIQEALADRENQLRTFFENTTDFIYLINAEGKFTYVNIAMQKAFGYTEEEFKNMHYSRLGVPEHLEATVKRVENKIKGKEKHTVYETVGMSKNGDRILLEINSSNVIKNGKIVGIQGIARDITERKAAERKIHESEAELRAIFESMSDVIVVHDKEGRFLKIPKTKADFLPKPAEEIIGQTVHEFFEKEDADFFLGKILEALEKQKPVEFDFEYKIAGQNRWFKTINTPMPGDLVMSITRDVTTSKKAETELRSSEERYRELFENANDLIYTTDLKGNFTSMNRAGEKITGYKRRQTLRGKINLAQIVAPEYLSKAVKEMKEKLKGKKPTIYDVEIISAQGKRVPLELSTRVIYHDGEPVGMQGIARDVSERKKSEAALKASERQYRLLSEGIMHLVWTAKPDGEPDFLNRRGLEYFGKTLEELSHQKWISLIHRDDVQEGLEKWKSCVDSGELFEYEFRLLRHDGVYRWYRVVGTAGLDSKGNVLKWFGTCTDIHAQKLAEEKLKHLAKHDSLTNLPNRAKFMDHLKRIINRDEMFKQYKFAVLFLDLDRFKVINDSLGHVIGDKLLVALAERLESCVRPGDIVARMGGDEFTILLNNLKEVEDALPVTNRLIQSINEPFYIDEYEVFTSASIGIVVSDDIERDPIGFLRDADAAMYRAKESGKARYEIFNEEMHIKNMALLRIENDLRKAIERNEFRMFYQPIISLKTGEICEFEALIRWEHPEQGFISPMEFIKVAEETGLIIPIGNWIIREVVRQNALWQKKFPHTEPFIVGINLSAKQLLHPPLCDDIRKVLAENRLNPHSLRFEVTETVVMGNDEASLNVLTELKKMGVSLSSDDFGTGYSSLSYLHRFPFDVLKIDRSFIGRLDTDRKSSEIVRTILNLAHNLHLEVIAEGIENEIQMKQLQALGCQFGQGYLFSKPITVAEVEKILAARSKGIPFSIPQSFHQNNFKSDEVH